MNPKDKLGKSIRHFAGIFSRQAETVRLSEKQIDAVYKPLAELMIEHTKEFPGFKLEKSNDKLLLSFEFESKSTLVKSALCFDAENNQFIRIR